MSGLFKGTLSGSQESYEMVDGSLLNDADLERGVDQYNQEASQSEGILSSGSTRSSTSLESQTSELLLNINKYTASNNEPEDFTSNPLFLRTKAGGIRRKICLLIVALFVFLWAALLVGYSLGAKSHYDYAKHFQKANSTANTTSFVASATGPSPTIRPAKSTTPLVEYDIHTSLEPIPTRSLGTDLLMDTVEFLDAGASVLSKQEDEGYYILKENNDFVIKKLADRTYSQILMKETTFKVDDHEYNIETIVPNYKLTHAIVMTDHESEFRHSGRSRYWLYDLTNGKFEPIIGEDENEKLSLAKWSPNFKYITFVQSNNLYIYDVIGKNSTKVTSDGSEDILNGRTDWVYEEEVFATDHAFWWSPDETNLIFMRTDDSKVPTQDLEFFISDKQYPKVEKLTYPKPGTPNPKVSLHKYNLETRKISEIDRSGSSLGDDFIVYNCEWIDLTNFVIRETDRESKILNHRVFNAESNTSKVTYTVDAIKEFNGWIDKFGEIFPLPKNSSAGREHAGYIDIIVVDGYNHLGYFERADSDKPKPLTSGQWEVTSGVLSFDADENLIYFTANRQSSFENHLYSLNLETRELTVMSEIDKVGHFSATFSPSSRYSVLTKDGPSFPLMYAKTSFRKRGILSFTGENKSFHKVKIDEDADGNPVTVNVLEVLPKKFDENGSHPLLVNIYGGPGSQKVTSKFSISFEDSISERLNAVILYIDPRGTGGQGWKYRSWSRGRIGYWEPRDITSLTKKWIDSRTYIDENRTAIWGWSYGGFTTLKTLEFDQGNIFKYGMSVAPVTDWSLYDSIYTERFMGLPQNNKEGYGEARVNNVDAFRTVKRFLVMHGTGDDNVHIQNSLRLFDKFDLVGVTNYDMQVFPDSNHNINYHNANLVIYRKLETWLINAFEGHFNDFAYK